MNISQNDVNFNPSLSLEAIPGATLPSDIAELNLSEQEKEELHRLKKRYIWYTFSQISNI